MGDVEIRQAGAEDIRLFYDGPPPHSMRAIVVTLDGKPIGLGGLCYCDDKTIAFTKITPELRAYPFAIYKAARIVMDMMKRRGGIVFAVADEGMPRARAFIEHLGFEQIDGEVYRWNQV